MGTSIGREEMTEEKGSVDPKVKEFNLPVKVFLSHPSDGDTDKVKDILERMSPQIELNMFPTTNYETDFTEAIRGSIEDVDVLVAILNKNGRRNQWVNQEVGIAVAKDIDIVVLAEENARKKHLLKGFVNEKNWTIVYMDNDDLEDKLHKWLVAYQEKHKITILQKVIFKDLIKLRRLTDVEQFECRDDPELNHVRTALGNLNANINKVLDDIETFGFIQIKNVFIFKEQYEKLINKELATHRAAKKLHYDFKKIEKEIQLLYKFQNYAYTRGVQREITWDSV